MVRILGGIPQIYRELDGPEKVSSTVRLVNGSYQVNISLAVAVHEYGDFDEFGMVVTRLVFFGSVAPPEISVGVRAESVEFLINKIGSDLGNHKAES